MSPNMKLACLVLLTIIVFGGLSAIILDAIGRHTLWMAGEVATQTDYIKYAGHYLPYEEI